MIVIFPRSRFTQKQKQNDRVWTENIPCVFIILWRSVDAYPYIINEHDQSRISLHRD